MPENRRTVDLFYSEDTNEKETDRRSDHLARDFGNGEAVGAAGNTAGGQALRRMRRLVHPADRTANF